MPLFSHPISERTPFSSQTQGARVLSNKGARMCKQFMKHVITFVRICSRRALLVATGYCVSSSGTRIPWFASAAAAPFSLSPSHPLVPSACAHYSHVQNMKKTSGKLEKRKRSHVQSLCGHRRRAFMHPENESSPEGFECETIWWAFGTHVPPGGRAWR